MSIFPRDDTNETIPALFPARAQTIDVSATSAICTSDFGGKVQVVDLTPTADMFIKFGAAGQAATSGDIFLKSGVPYTYQTSGNLRIAAIRDTADGKLHITELE